MNYGLYHQIVPFSVLSHSKAPVVTNLPYSTEAMRVLAYLPLQFAVWNTTAHHRAVAVSEPGVVHPLALVGRNTMSGPRSEVSWRKRAFYRLLLQTAETAGDISIWVAS